METIFKKTIAWTPLYENNIYKSSYGALQNEKYEEEKKTKQNAR